MTAAHLINRTPTKIHTGKKTPYELLFGVAPSYNQLRVFGSSCYIHHRPRDKEKFSPRSRHCIFVGYPYGKKSWREYDIENTELLVSRDVVFQENIFPFEASHTTIPASLSSLSIVDDDWLVTSSRASDNGGRIWKSHQLMCTKIIQLL